MRNSLTQRFACELRRVATDTERYLWRHLRDRQIVGFTFRSQVPLGPYVADFACLEKRLIVELDGGQHGEHKEYDEVRDAWLKASGFTVLRFWNDQVFKETGAVLEVIANNLRPHPRNSSWSDISLGEKDERA
ncbi:MAG: endonuclease domain-containing protein [Panacagrimonas sp.]